MAVAKDDSTEWSWSHWAGSPEDLAEAARLAAERVAAAAPFPEGYDPDDPDHRYDAEQHDAFLRAKSARRLEIKVAEQDGYRSNLHDVDELAGLPERRLKEIKSIRIAVGRPFEGDVGVEIRVSRDSGLAGEVYGDERAWTAGVRHELEKILKPRERLHAPLLNEPWVAFMGAGYAFIAVLAAVVFSLQWLSPWGRPTRNAVGLSAATLATAAIVFAGVASLLRLELLRSGRPRYQRWRRAVLATTWTVILGVAASVIYGAFDS